jgi:hypothetical protein
MFITDNVAIRYIRMGLDVQVHDRHPRFVCCLLKSDGFFTWGDLRS